jgi:hypothetical protein
MQSVKRFDMDKKPKKEKWFLTPLAYLLSFPAVKKRHLHIRKVDIDGLKPPYILLCTHHAFLDFKVTTKAIYPYRANYIVAIDGFIKREWLLRNVGGICKRKFTNDTKLFRNIKYALENLNQVMAIYPEARYSIDGTTAILPESLGKMMKVLNYPVVILNMHGNYLSQPVWNLKERVVDITADMTKILDKDEAKTLGVDEINKRISDAFKYDEWQYQKDHHIIIDEPFRAEGLDAVLYQCPHCLTEHHMSSKGHTLTCLTCQESYVLETTGHLRNTNGNTLFDHVPNWFKWQKDMVRKDILSGSYKFNDEVMIESLPNAKGYIPLGKGQLSHDLDGFKLEFTEDNQQKTLIKEPLSMYGLHIEYNYFEKGDCIDLSTLDDTYYIYPIHKKQVVTKLHFATEILYEIAKNNIK